MAGLPALMLLHIETKDKYVDLLRSFNNKCFWQQKAAQHILIIREITTESIYNAS